MSRTAELLERLNTEQPSDALRSAIIDHIAATLTALRDGLGYWEKACIGQAIACCYANVAGSSEPRNTWLTLALVNLDHALVPPTERNESYTKKETAIEALRYEDLTAALRQLGAKV